MEQRSVSLETCARCSGRFPGPGIGMEGKVYCCDCCAAGVGHGVSAGRWMATRMLPVVALLFGAGTLGWTLRTTGGRAALLKAIGASSVMWASLSQAGGAASRLGGYLAGSWQGRRARPLVSQWRSIMPGPRHLVSRAVR